MAKQKIKDIIVKTMTHEQLYGILNIELPSNQELYVDLFAIYQDKYAIDTDCCFWELNGDYQNGEIVKTILIECRIKHLHENGYKMRADKADFIRFIPLSEFLDKAVYVNLTDFIRYNYNSRIISNQSLLMKYINQ